MSLTNARLKGRATSFSVELALLVAVALTLLPILWLVWSSLKLDKDIANLDGIAAPTLANYESVLGSGSAFPGLIFNSLAVVVFTTILCVAVGSLAAYSLSRFRWPRSLTVALLGASLLVQLVPQAALVPAYYQLLSGLGLLDSIAGLVLVNTVFNLPFAVFLLKVYFDSVPNDLKDIALVDGCTGGGAFWRVMLPLAAPGVAAVTILVSVLTWNDFLMALSLTLTPNAQTVPVGIANFMQNFSVQFGDLTAAATIATVPLVILAAVAHRYIVAGLTGGALKE
jgi:ABC-type glycerol-3-phosphate transport system permease component